ncbi:peptidase M50, partial [Mycobacterium rufum]|nr:peptidase M50 [Mycolicibacterium rufum]
RAAQLGTTGALVERDGVPGARPVRRSTFYRHTEGWLRVGRR